MKFVWETPEEINLEVAKRLSVEPEHCLVFEDIPAGIIAGKRAGMTVIAVEDDFSKEMKAQKCALADGFIETYFEIFNCCLNHDRFGH